MNYSVEFLLNHLCIKTYFFFFLFFFFKYQSSKVEISINILQV